MINILENSNKKIKIAIKIAIKITIFKTKKTIRFKVKIIKREKNTIKIAIVRTKDKNNRNKIIKDKTIRSKVKTIENKIAKDKTTINITTIRIKIIIILSDSKLKETSKLKKIQIDII